MAKGAGEGGGDGCISFEELLRGVEICANKTEAAMFVCFRPLFSSPRLYGGKLS